MRGRERGMERRVKRGREGEICSSPVLKRDSLATKCKYFLPHSFFHLSFFFSAFIPSSSAPPIPFLFFSLLFSSLLYLKFVFRKLRAKKTLHDHYHISPPQP